MKFQLDENFDLRLTTELATAGHDVDSVRAEGISGADDDTVFQACRTSGRALITLDLDFSNPFRFPPENTKGIIVVRPPRPVLSVIRATLVSVLPQLKTLELKGTLWIVEPGRVRIYDPDPGEGHPDD